MKFEKIYDCDGIVSGYKCGIYYIMKHYTWCNHYEWIINTDGTNHYCESEFWKEVDNQNIYLCESLKQAKEKVKQLLS